MFNWTTTTIINSLKDYTTGADLAKVWTGAGDADANGLKPGFSGAYPVLKIKRDHTFEARYVSKVYKAIANNPTLCEMTIDAEALLGLVDVTEAPAHVRLSFYVALEGSEESIYANDWYQKGKPFSIGFDIKKGETDAEKVAEKIVKNANKFGVVTYGKKIFDIANDGATITLKGTHEYQRFKMAAVSVDDLIDEIIVDFFEDGEVAEGEKSENEVFSLVKRGINGFGTYHQLVKDLRLPTVHHNKWLQIKEDEKPVLGAKYNQYIVTYCAPSMANPGFTVIGQHNMSVTTHVFWVNQAVDEAFAKLFEDAGITVTAVNEVETKDAEEVTLKIGGVDEVTYTEDGIKTTAGENYSANHEQKHVHVEAEEGDVTAKA